MKTRKKGAKPEERGIYRKGGKPALWLRYTYEGEQVRVPLHTRDMVQAIKLAKQLRDQPPPNKKLGNGGWRKAVEKYLDEKQNPKRPTNFAGRRWRTFRPGTVPKVRSCLLKFGTWTGTTNPHNVTKKQLEDYRDQYAKKSNASARTTIATILAFLEHVGHFPGQIQLSEKSKLERRELVLPISEGNRLIDGAPSDRLKFVLFSGFHAGLRRGEIMHSRPSWFQFERGILRVPRVDELRENLWQVKDSEMREIPLSKGFASFLKKFLKGVPADSYCLTNPAKRSSKTGVYDFLRPFKKYAAEAGVPELYPHAMRHSWITELCNSGNHTIQEVAAWSGDSIETIEKNYWHKKATAGALDSTMEGVRKDSKQSEQMAQILQSVENLQSLVTGKKKSKFSEEEIKALARKYTEDMKAFLVGTTLRPPQLEL